MSDYLYYIYNLNTKQVALMIQLCNNTGVANKKARLHNYSFSEIIMIV